MQLTGARAGLARAAMELMRSGRCLSEAGLKLRRAGSRLTQSVDQLQQLTLALVGDLGRVLELGAER